MRSISLNDIRQIAPCTWEIPRSFRSDMRVNARLYASREMIDHLITMLQYERGGEIRHVLDEVVSPVGLDCCDERVFIARDLCLASRAIEHSGHAPFGLVVRRYQGTVRTKASRDAGPVSE